MTKKLLFILYFLSIGIVQSQTFNVGGINYEITSGTEVKVIASTTSGDLVIPETVNYSSTDYTVTLIEAGAFLNQFGLNSVVIPNSVTSIGNNAFNGCFGMTSLDIGDAVTSIGESSFEGCASLTSVIIPNLVETIGVSSFQSCDGLLSISIPDSVTSIGEYAFYGCTAVTTISIGDSVASIGEFTFGVASSISNLTAVDCAIATPLVINANVFANRVISSCSLNVYPGSLSAYQAADVWKNFNPINGALNIENKNMADEFNLHPNPARSRLFVEVKNINNAKLKIYNLLGKMQFSQTLTKNTNTINIEKLPTGIYLMNIISDEGTTSKKIIKY